MSYIGFNHIDLITLLIALFNKKTCTVKLSLTSTTQDSQTFLKKRGLWFVYLSLQLFLIQHNYLRQQGYIFISFCLFVS